MTGTPLDLTPFGVLLKGLGLLYWGLLFGALALVLWKIKGWVPKLLGSFVLLVVFVTPVAWRVYERTQKQNEAKARLDASMALFNERCKTAGEKILRSVENVEGILLTGVRPVAKSSDLSDPNWPDAALPQEGQGDWYVRNFLNWEHHDDKRTPRGFLNEQPSALPGYRFVDVGSGDGSTYRYRLAKAGDSALSREVLKGQPARYAVSFVNLSNPGDRAKWVAGTTVSVTDTTTGEVLAESTWYSIEPGQGSTAGFRAPWGFAKTCPELRGWVGAPTRFFVDRVLKPAKGG